MEREFLQNFKIGEQSLTAEVVDTIRIGKVIKGEQTESEET